jgi:hypothetical protein
VRMAGSSGDSPSLQGGSQVTVMSVIVAFITVALCDALVLSWPSVLLTRGTT